MPQPVESDDVDNNGDILIDAMDDIHGNSHVTQRVPVSSALDSSDEEGISDDDDDMSAMLNITTNFYVHSGADSSNPWLDGFDIWAGDVCAERLQCVRVSEDVVIIII